MALSGSQKTQVGRQYAGVGKKQSFSAKSPGVGGGFVPFPLHARGVHGGKNITRGGKQ